MKIALSTLALAAAVLAGCGGAGDEASWQVTYTASGPAPLDVTYSSGGELLHEQAASGSFRRDIVARAGDTLLVSAQTPDPTFVVATISLDGGVLKAATARGQAIATATCCQLP